MKATFVKNQLRRAVKIYKKATGLEPEIYEISQHDEDSDFISIHLSRKVKHAPGLITALTPHLVYSFDRSETYPSKFKWNGLKKWLRKQNKKSCPACHGASLKHICGKKS